jgi:hypothetical protein
MTVREYAESFKSFNGTALGAYEMFKDVSTTPATAITEYLNALPDAVIATFPPYFKTTADIAAAVIPLGVVLAKYFPAVVVPPPTPPAV